MKRKHLKTLKSIFAHPVSGNVQWQDIEALFIELALKSANVKAAGLRWCFLMK